MKAAVLLNVAAGSVDAAETREEIVRIADAFRAAGIEAKVRPVEAEHLPDLVRQAAASDVDVVVAGGGDGTLSAAAAALSGGAKPLGVLPLGTRNHFAKDMGIPLDLEDAVRTIAEGHVREVDVGEVNGRVFINNSSIGLYPRIVETRDEQRERQGRGKWLAMFLAALAVLRRFPLWRVRLRIGGDTLPRFTPLVFVGNNLYEEGFLTSRGRSCLDRGELGLYVARTTGRLGLVRLALRALIGRLDQDRDFEAMCVSEVDIEAGRRSLRVAVDGEVARMRPPLRYRTRPRALRVVAPEPGS